MELRLSKFIKSLFQRVATTYRQLTTLLFYGFRFGKIGRRTIVFSPLRLINPQNVFLGEEVYLYKQARIETIKQWGNEYYNPTIMIGNRVSFQQRLHLTCAKLVEIGDDTVVLPDVMITDINHSYREINKNIMLQPIEVRETKIGKYCFLGMGARIMAGTKLGDNCIVGSNAVVSGTFPGFVVVAGTPAKIIKRYDFATSTWKKTNSKGAFIDEI